MTLIRNRLRAVLSIYVANVIVMSTTRDYIALSVVTNVEQGAMVILTYTMLRLNLSPNGQYHVHCMDDVVQHGVCVYNVHHAAFL